jgi:hypothetical protein
VEEPRTLHEPAAGNQMSVRFVSGEAYEIAVRGHRIAVDQPVDGGGDLGSTPTELFVASLPAALRTTRAAT